MTDYSIYVEKLPTNPVDALNVVCGDFSEMHAENKSDNSGKWQEYHQIDYQTYFRLAWKFIDLYSLEVDANKTAPHNVHVVSFFDYFTGVVSGWVAGQIFDRKYAETSDSIIFSDAEQLLIQEKTNELRSLVRSADYLDEKHRLSILKRLEKFQLELHKPISNRDAFFAGWAEVNDMVDDTGKKSKEIVDRFREIMGAISNAGQKLIGTNNKPKLLEDQTEEVEGDE